MNKITLFAKMRSLIGLTIILSAFSTITHAQTFCDNEQVYFLENFGTGTSSSSNADVLSLTYQSSGILTSEGVYRVINNTQQKPEWHNSPDHTIGDVNGKMLVVNGQAETFYSHTVVKATGFTAGFYSVSLFLMNVNTPGTCAPNPLLPSITFKVEYRAANNSWIQLSNSPVTAAPAPQSANPSWIQAGGVFTLPTTGTFQVTRIRITLSDGTVGGCGNDFAIDDIKLASCPSGGPVPVEFLNITAQQKGSGVSINWATASELNNKYFDVEKSNDGGLSWYVVGTVQSQGNSSITRNYAAYDAKPASGINYFRVKQVDFDGTAKYSATVIFNLKIVKTDVSVLVNPFRDNITIDFLSTRNQVLNSRLFEISGKLVMSQQISISKGSSRKIIDAVSNLNRGMYILQITDETGALLYNDKLIKQ